MQTKKRYQILLHGKEWTKLKKGVELGDGRLEYVRRTGTAGIAETGEWRIHPASLSKSKFAFVPAPRIETKPKRGLWDRFLTWFGG